MVLTVPKAVKLWGRGQLTIPKEAREALQLDEATPVSVFVVGRCLVLTPKRLQRAPLAKAVERTMQARDVTLDELLRDLKAERRRYNRQAYGR